MFWPNYDMPSFINKTFIKQIKRKKKNRKVTELLFFYYFNSTALRGG